MLPSRVQLRALLLLLLVLLLLCTPEVDRGPCLTTCLPVHNNGLCAMCRLALCQLMRQPMHNNGLCAMCGLAQVPLRFVVQAAAAEAALLQQQLQQQGVGGGLCGEQGAQAMGEGCDDKSEGDAPDSEGLSEFGLGDLNKGVEDDAVHAEAEEEEEQEVQGVCCLGRDGGAQAGMARRRGSEGATAGKAQQQSAKEAGVAGGKGWVRSIRGLGLRLRLCARYGIMPRSGVFKVYHAAALNPR